MPFDILLDRRKRSKFIGDIGKDSEKVTKPKVVKDAGVALASMLVCEEALERELFISTSYVYLLLIVSCIVNLSYVELEAIFYYLDHI